jgi:putative ABC transport system permease protein
MTFRQFAFNNVLRNKRTYAAYFLSSVFSVMVFFVYAVFAFHPELASGQINKNIASGMHTAEGIIYVFSFFFVLYSMSAFLKTRKKEFGLMVMLGMSNTQLRLMVFLENVLIGFFATLTGIGVGLVLSKLLLLLAENVLMLENSLPFYLPKQALMLTFAAFIILFVLISLFTVAILRGNKLIDLIKGSSAPKSEPKFSRILSWFAVLLLVGGYIIALIVKGMFVVFAMIPVTVMVIVGTYFLFTQLSVYVIHKAKRNRSYFWRRTNMLFLSDLAYRMKDNARTFFMVAILSTVAFSAIGSLVGFKTMTTEILLTENPFAFSYESYEEENEEIKADMALIEKTLKEDQIPYQRLEVAKGDYKLRDSEQEVMIVKASQYNVIAAAAGDRIVDLKENQAIRIYYMNPLMKDEQAGTSESIQLSHNQIDLKLIGSQASYALNQYRDYYVVADDLVDQLEPNRVRMFYAFDVEEWKKTQETGERLTKLLSKNNAYFTPLAHEWHKMNQGYAVVLFIGLFIGAVFFVAAGSFLYFRLYADLDEDKFKFASIMKLGLTDGELSHIVTKQLVILFFVPIAVATVHGAIALTALQHMFGYSMMKESFLVLGSFVSVQLIYFLFIRVRYIKQVLA